VKIVLEFAKRAQDEIERKAQEWRDGADEKELFEQELAEAFARIKKHPGSGQPYSMSRGKRVLRVYMPKTENHAYYRQDGPELVRVMCVWGSRRKHNPKLR
jgi:plasmid stabilization system protein ParE